MKEKARQVDALVRAMGGGPSKTAFGAVGGVPTCGLGENPVFDFMVKRFGIECMRYVEKWQREWLFRKGFA